MQIRPSKDKKKNNKKVLKETDLKEEFNSERLEINKSTVKTALNNNNTIVYEELNSLNNNKNLINLNPLDDSEDDSEDDFDNNSEDNSQNFRDKDKELKELVKSKLSLKSQNVIDNNDEELQEIIENLKKKCASKDKGLELQKIRNTTRGRTR